VDLPEVFCVILYLLKSGCQWRMLPERLSEMAQGLPLFLVMEREPEDGTGLLAQALKN
jgi:hypothetical protein